MMPIGWLALVYITDWSLLGAHLILSDADWLQSSSYLHDRLCCKGHNHTVIFQTGFSKLNCFGFTNEY